jgi:DNA invertase Pin-like site-specific DNA recombinase
MNKQAKRVAIYLRVSTTDQTTENQRRELKAVADRHGWTVAQVFEDNGISGAKARDARPGLDAMMKAVSRREIDMVLAWSVDRLGRSLTGLLELLAELHAKRVDLYLHQQGLDTSTPSGKAMFQMMGVFAEFERAMIRERVLAGIARARANGTRTGKPIGRPPIEAKTEAAIRSALKKGDIGMRKIAVNFKVATGTVQRIAKEIGATAR